MCCIYIHVDFICLMLLCFGLLFGVEDGWSQVAL
jgi:hypothetical protein